MEHSELDSFQSKRVRQGCSLSPTLFNIYINELAEKLTSVVKNLAVVWVIQQLNAPCMQMTSSYCHLPERVFYKV